jgi:LysR family transcriptional regulator for metE and metH
MLELRHLRLVRAIAEEGGPTRAAPRLHLTQSAVSHQLADLEARLGVDLFTRVRRRLILTAAGRLLVELSSTTLAEISRVERELQRAGSRTRVPLRISTESFTCYHWLPRVLPELQRDYPHIDVRIVIEATEQPVAALLRGELDLAVISSPVRDRKLIVTELFDDEWVIILPTTHHLCRQEFVSASDLGGNTLYAHKTPQRDIERLRARLAAERAKMPTVQIVPLTEVIVELVKAGLGIGLMSRWAVRPYERSGQIATRRFTRAGLLERWSLVYRRDSPEPRPISRIAELLAEQSTVAAHSTRSDAGKRARVRRAR